MLSCLVLSGLVLVFTLRRGITVSAMVCHASAYYARLYVVVLCDCTSCRVMSCYAAPCHAMRRQDLFCDAVVHFTLRCWVTPSLSMLRRGMPMSMVCVCSRHARLCSRVTRQALLLCHDLISHVLMCYGIRPCTLFCHAMLPAVMLCFCGYLSITIVLGMHHDLLHAYSLLSHFVNMGMCHTMSHWVSALVCLIYSHTLLRYVVCCHAATCYVVLLHVVSCHVAERPVILCHACHLMKDYGVLC